VVSNASDFDDFPIIGEDGFTMIRIGVVDAIEEADPVTDRERKARARELCAAIVCVPGGR
jgi:hypothetical protein